MNVNQLLIQAFGPFISSFWWLIPLFITVAILKTPFIKGVIGEFQVNLAAKFFLDKHIYTLFKNVTLPTEDGTTQIDHVIVSRYGVFVIETKNMKGWIFGSPNKKPEPRRFTGTQPNSRIRCIKITNIPRRYRQL